MVANPGETSAEIRNSVTHGYREKNRQNCISSYVADDEATRE